MQMLVLRRESSKRFRQRGLHTSIRFVVVAVLVVVEADSPSGLVGVVVVVDVVRVSCCPRPVVCVSVSVSVSVSEEEVADETEVVKGQLSSPSTWLSGTLMKSILVFASMAGSNRTQLVLVTGPQTTRDEVCVLSVTSTLRKLPQKKGR